MLTPQLEQAEVLNQHLHPPCAAAAQAREPLQGRGRAAHAYREGRGDDGSRAPSDAVTCYFVVRQHIRHAQRPRRLQLAREQGIHAAVHRLVNGVRGARVRLPGRGQPQPA